MLRYFSIFSLCAVFLFIGMGVKEGVHEKVVETEKLIIRSAGKQIVLSDGKIQILDQEEKAVVDIEASDEGYGEVTLYSQSGKPRIELSGGQSPAVYLRSEEGEVIGALLTMQDGGAAVGLADKQGNVAALLRGGEAPSVSLFQNATQPNIAIGIAKETPHFLLTSKKSRDSLLVHGGETTSLLFVDAGGQVPVFLSKHGVFQGKEQKSSDPSEPASEEKMFTWEEITGKLEDLNFKSSH